MGTHLTSSLATLLAGAADSAGAAARDVGAALAGAVDRAGASTAAAIDRIHVNVAPMVLPPQPVVVEVVMPTPPAPPTPPPAPPTPEPVERVVTPRQPAPPSPPAPAPPSPVPEPPVRHHYFPTPKRFVSDAGVQADGPPRHRAYDTSSDESSLSADSLSGLPIQVPTGSQALQAARDDLSLDLSEGEVYVPRGGAGRCLGPGCTHVGVEAQARALCAF
jgi:outer membrane biosynthesis protein TonB